MPLLNPFASTSVRVPSSIMFAMSVIDMPGLMVRWAY